MAINTRLVIGARDDEGSGSEQFSPETPRSGRSQFVVSEGSPIGTENSDGKENAQGSGKKGDGRGRERSGSSRSAGRGSGRGGGGGSGKKNGPKDKRAHNYVIGGSSGNIEEGVKVVGGSPVAASRSIDSEESHRSGRPRLVSEGSAICDEKRKGKDSADSSRDRGRAGDAGRGRGKSGAGRGRGRGRGKSNAGPGRGRGGRCYEIGSNAGISDNESYVEEDSLQITTRSSDHDDDASQLSTAASSITSGRSGARKSPKHFMIVGSDDSVAPPKVEKKSPRHLTIGAPANDSGAAFLPPVKHRQRKSMVIGQP